MYVYMWVCACECSTDRSQKRASDPPGAAVMGSSELPNLGAENQSQVLSARAEDALKLLSQVSSLKMTFNCTDWHLGKEDRYTYFSGVF